MRFISFDPGIGSPGLVVLEQDDQGSLSLLHHQVIRTKSSEPLTKRLKTIWAALSKSVIDWRPDWFVIEEQRSVQAGKFQKKEFNADNSKTILTVGVAMGAAMAYGVQFAEIRTQTAKLLATGNRSASKHDVQAAVKRRLGIELPQDSADAAANGIAFASLSPVERRELADKAPKPKRRKLKEAV